MKRRHGDVVCHCGGRHLEPASAVHHHSVILLHHAAAAAAAAAVDGACDDVDDDGVFRRIFPVRDHGVLLVRHHRNRRNVTSPPYNQSIKIIIHADGSRCVGRVISRVCDFVCVCVCASVGLSLSAL